MNLKEYFKKNKTTIVDLIDKAGNVKALPRPYLGMSQLGEECWRKLWYSFRWCEYSTYDGRVQRIFDVGHKAEVDMVKDLEKIGVKTWDTLDNQKSFIAVSGHCKGHGDGVGSNIPGAEKTNHLLEFKTSSSKHFKEMEKKGVKESKPVHYAQMVLYMKFSKLTRALYMMYNKDTSAYYIERIKSNNNFADELIKKAEDIITCEDVNVFQKIGSGNPSFYKCKFCDYSDICHNDSSPVKTCRTCVSGNLLDGGIWGCGIQKDKHLNLLKQKEACSNYQKLECFNV